MNRGYFYLYRVVFLNISLDFTEHRPEYALYLKYYIHP